MKENEEKQPPTVYNQLAFILNYQPTIDQQHIHIGEKSADVKQETKSDDEKRKRLEASNTIFRTHSKSGKQALDLLKLYRFIDRFFVSEITHKYEWYALRRFLEKYNLLRDCDNVQFAKQMNHEAWFFDPLKKTDVIITYG